MRVLVAGVFVLGCATATRPQRATTPAIVETARPLHCRVQLQVVDPTDLQARLASLVRQELSTRGITTTPTAKLVVHVVVLTRRRHDEPMQMHDPGTRPPSGFGFVGEEEPFEFGSAYTQSDLRLSVSAALFRMGSSTAIASWDDEEGTLVRRDGEARPHVSPWQAVYAAVARKLADQIAAAIASSP